MAIFRTNGTTGIGSQPVSNASADLDGDGHLDLLFTNYASDNVSVLFGDGAGGFTAGTPVPATNGPREIWVGDLNGDGHIDFAATNLSGNIVTIALNDGSGAFTPSTFAVGVGPRGLALGDVDGDGDLDLVSANYSADTLTVGLNNGTGGFTEAATSPLTTGGSRPVEVTMADFNGDGDLDIATTNNSSNTVGVLLGHGDGSFDAAVTYAVGSSPRPVTAYDIDGDGDIDLAVANFNAASVSILTNDGTGVFAVSQTVTTGNNPYDVKFADLDGDGDADMVVNNSGGSSVSVFLANGSGNFTAGTGAPFSVGISPGGLTLGDFDEDGDADIATTNFGSNSTTILLNTMATYSVTAASATEGTAPGSAGELVFTVTRNADSEAEDVTFALTGSATAGTDYTAPVGTTISFVAGQTTAEVRIALLVDGTAEANETVILTLTGTNGAGTPSVLSGHATATATDDDPPTILRGTSGTDVLRGTENAEVFYGHSGNDIVRAFGGDDQIVGGLGNDRLFGGAGADVFVFNRVRESAADSGAKSGDVIMDFVQGTDSIDLSNIDADRTINGSQDFTWRGTGAFTGAGAELMFQQFDRAGTADDRTLVYGDTNHDGRADFTIRLAGLINLQASDFVF